MHGAQRRQALPRQRKHRRRRLRFERQRPALRRLDRIAWAEDVEVRDCPQRRQMLDRLMRRSEEHTSELQSLMRISYAVFCLKKKIELRQIIHINTKMR